MNARRCNVNRCIDMPSVTSRRRMLVVLAGYWRLTLAFPHASRKITGETREKLPINYAADGVVHFEIILSRVFTFVRACTHLFYDIRMRVENRIIEIDMRSHANVTQEITCFFSLSLTMTLELMIRVIYSGNERKYHSNMKYAKF